MKSSFGFRRSGSVALLTVSALLATAPVYSQSEPLGGQPRQGSKASVPDLEAQVAYQRAFETVVWSIPAVSIYRFREGIDKTLGIGDNDILAMSKPLTQLGEFLTANNVTPYILASTDLRGGPVVLEVPAKTDKAELYGQIADAWQVTIADVGPSGADKGEGGKYLLIPPGYKEPIPADYIPVQSESYRLAFSFRSIALGAATDADANAYAKTLKMYPLAQAANPHPTKFVDGEGVRLSTLPFYDLRYFQDLHDVISVEPVRPRDKVMMGMLATIGIEPGKPFNPDAKTKAAMLRAVTDAYFYMHANALKAIVDHPVWQDRHWGIGSVPDQDQGFEYVTDTAVNIDARAIMFHLGTFYPRVLAPKSATVCLAATADSKGRPLESGETYRLKVPKDMPVSQFWALTVYDKATWAFIYSPLGRVGLSGRDVSKMKVNTDGSVDLYFGPAAPKGLETNWIPTEQETVPRNAFIWTRR
jgi:hypothetical protein